MNILNIRFELKNPFDRWEFFKALGCISGRLRGHKAWELEHSYMSTMLVDMDVKWTRNRDHAGFHMMIGILGYGVQLTIYDTRHWDYTRNDYADPNS